MNLKDKRDQVHDAGLLRRDLGDDEELCHYFCSQRRNKER